MISIKENTSLKLSGKTSLFISFNYNEEIIKILKDCDVAVYHKKLKLWEVPINAFAEIVDKLTFIDDIAVEFLKDKQENLSIQYYPKLKYKTSPFEYQLEGITYGLNNDKWLLLDSPGLGKTLQAIYLAEELSAQKGLKHCLIVCGIATLRANWEKEIKKHSSKDCIVIGKHENSKGTIVWDSVAKRAEQLRNKIDEFFIIINVESLRNNEIINALKESVNDIDMVILDEAHKCLDGDTLVQTNLGKITIKEIVDKKLDIKVLTLYNDDISYSDVVNFFKLPCEYDSLIELKIMGEDGEIRSLKCTPDHLINTFNRGFIEAQYLTTEDEIILE